MVINMSQVIAGIYELKEKIGAGGGGVVYLGEHIRLRKPIVLKADKRKLSVGEEKLRREVDLLKGLSHTYIPQVYDFVPENETVYTVMDFIEGESLDKMIGRGQRPAQPDVIKWACQLLEALDYLHSQPPYGILHGDIKPANIMLRPNGDVCLIDFNIALALGEEGAVKVGFSRGYASPEHYGADYIKSNKAAAVKSGTTLKGTTLKGTALKETALRKTALRKTALKETLLSRKQQDNTDETLADEETAVDDKTAIDTQTATGEQTAVDEYAEERSRDLKMTAGAQKGILLDVRSDIYSLGATLYHLISGIRPEQDARDVKPLDKSVCSEAVSLILQKAMNPQPDERYQTAKEMLQAFLYIHKRDIRTIRHKRRMITSAVALTTMLFTGAAVTFVGLKQLGQRQEALALSEYSANALTQGDISSAVSYALQAIPDSQNIFHAPVTAQAQAALANALGVYDLSQDFKPLDTLALPSAPFDLAVSPKGTRLAVVYAYETAVFDLESLKKLASFPTRESALSDCVFLDETHIVYAGTDGVTCCDLDTGQTLWKAGAATTLAVSADKTVIAAVDRDADCAVLYRSKDGKKIAERSFDGRHLTVPANDIFADAQNDIFALNADGRLLAVSFSNGGFQIYDCENPDNDLIIYEESEYNGFSGGFCGTCFAFTARESGKSQFGIIDVGKGIYAGGYETLDKLHIQADENGIYLASGKLIEKIDVDTMTELEMALSNDADIAGFAVKNIGGKEYTLIATDDDCFSFYDSGAGLMSTNVCDKKSEFTALGEGFAVVGNRNDPMLRILQLESGKGETVFSYDARYVHDEARISCDKKTAMLFSYQGFRIYGTDGNLIAELELPDSDNIYDQQFRKDENGSWLEVIWYDGMRRNYSAADGSLIKEEQGEAPNKDLYEEFDTEKYRITSSLHDAPQVYLAESEKRIGELETEDYLTYVSQFGDYLISEYISTSGQRYGLLLDEKLQTIATLQGLCDISEGMLVFDYGDGILRQCRLYTLEELIALGETYIVTEK